MSQVAFGAPVASVDLSQFMSSTFVSLALKVAKYVIAALTQSGDMPTEEQVIAWADQIFDAAVAKMPNKRPFLTNIARMAMHAAIHELYGALAA